MLYTLLLTRSKKSFLMAENDILFISFVQILCKTVFKQIRYAQLF